MWHVTHWQSTCLNPQINIFDPNTPNLFDASSNPWSVYIDKSVDQDVASLINPGIREYTRVFTLPEAITSGNFTRHVLLFGKAGKIVLASLDPDVPMSQRLYVPPNAARPKSNCGKDYSDQVLFPALSATSFFCNSYRLHHIISLCFARLNPPVALSRTGQRGASM